MKKKTINKKNSYALKGKTIFLTGALGQIGRTLTLHLLEEGAFVYLGDVKRTLPKDFEKEIKLKKYTAYKYTYINVASEKSILATKAKLTKDVNVLINCAGIGVYTPFEDRLAEDLDRVFQVNLKGTILCSKIFSKDMIKQKDGRIINFGSIYGMATPDFSIYGDSGRNSSEIYGATKAGIIHVTNYLAAYLAKYNILVNAVSPGGIYRQQDPYFVERYIAKTPMGRMGEADDLTGIIAFLCSDESKYITGQNIAVDGGFTLW